MALVFVGRRFPAIGILLAEATKGVPGVTAHNEQVVAFAARQILDAFCPTNFVGTNPDLAYETFRSGGGNLVLGGLNALEDMRRTLTGAPLAGTEKFKVGENLAVTPGKVIYPQSAYRIDPV